MIRKSLNIFHIRKPGMIRWSIRGCVTGVLTIIVSHVISTVNNSTDSEYNGIHLSSIRIKSELHFILIPSGCIFCP